MTPTHEELREWAGAYALGALDPDDRRTFERHLVECTRCAAEVKAFAPIPGLLAQIDPDHLETGSERTAGVIVDRARQEANSLRSSRNRWRAVASGAAAVVLVAIGALVVGIIGDDTDTPPPVVTADVTASEAAATSISTSARGWGTEIFVTLDGLPIRDRYQLWAIGDDGTWNVAANWGPTPTGGAMVTGATSIATDALDRVIVTSNDRSDVIVDASI